MQDYSSFRDAARRGIQAAGCDPVLVEDLPSLPVSPRTACLDTVRSCDVYVGVLGPRAGSETPSGRTVVEEELEEARTHGLPILVFLQNGDHEPRQQEFVDRISEFVEGRYRVSFVSPEELEQEVESSLEALDPMVNEDPEAAAQWVSARVADGLIRGQDATLRIAIAPVRQEEVIDPREMEKAGRTILDLGHAEDVGLLSYGSGYEVEILRESVRLRPTDRRGTRQPHSRAAVELDENGRLLVESNVRGLQERNGRSSGLEIVEGDVAVQIGRTLSLTAGFYDSVDPHFRHQHFVYQATLHGIQYHQLVAEADAGHGGGTMLMSGDDVTAHPEPRQVNRRALANPADEVERTMERFRRSLGR